MENSVAVTTESPACFICKGAGKREVRAKIDGYKVKVVEICKTCNGNGFIAKSKRKNKDGTFRKKIAKSYPSFTANGPNPVHIGNSVFESTNDDEDLSYLVGHYRIFQRIDRHRYSTDDLVTSWISIKENAKLKCSNPHYYLDIGCGIGSVLLSNAWQLPESTCMGIEVQQSRYSQAIRSITYNLGVYPSEQSRVHAYNCDLRDWASIQTLTGRSHFDLITGTPPYFDPGTQASQTTCAESLGCLFEMKGSIDQYCLTASKLLRVPDSVSSTDSPSIFVVCHSSLHSASVYLACFNSDLVVLKRTDVVPKVGKPPLFSVFVVALYQWLGNDYITSNYPNLHTEKLMTLKDACNESEIHSLLASASFESIVTADSLSKALHIVAGHVTQDASSVSQSGRVFGSVYGEEYDAICVRAADGTHTVEYAALLRDLNKPSSFDREIFDPACHPKS